MRTSIEVKDRHEGAVIKVALDNKATRSFVVLMGLLLPMSPRVRARILTYVGDAVNDPAFANVDLAAELDAGQLDADAERTAGNVERAPDQGTQ